ncbi:restriction endonuclease subunit S [Enterococcus faecalis]|uniref:restriction endonuclease subunit S n=1 Tax=Enterococcus faecalis TaxID=1351 RepID=UPI000CF31D2E|nr:restriction endonuclease subunit S [Enterococcus faecalis]PQG99784.1 restriction endonuclease subunit S [Enterococcus faecalis]
MRDEMKKVPRLRFRGFSEDWELCKLGEVFDFKQGVQVPVEEQFTTLEEGMQRFIRIVDLTTDEEPPRYIKYDSDNLVSESDLFMVRYGAVGVIGLGYEGVIANNLFKLIPRIVVDEKFSYHQLIKNKDKIISLSSSTTMPALSFKTLKNLSFSVSSVDEQKQIGSFFANLDNLITLHQRKLDQLKELKKAYLQLMFPKKDETVPRVRFADFEDDWQLCKLGETFSIIMGQSPNSENYTENPDDYILVQGNSDMKNNKVVPRIWTTQVTKKAEKGDLILSVRAPVGEIGKTDYNVVLGRGVAAVKGNDFIFQQLRKMKDSGYWTRYSTGSTFESINSNDIKEALINIPNKDEQQKIGDLFTHLDDAIILNQNKLNQLKSLKKSYLQNMFI